MHSHRPSCAKVFHDLAVRRANFAHEALRKIVVKMNAIVATKRTFDPHLRRRAIAHFENLKHAGIAKMLSTAVQGACFFLFTQFT